MLRSLSSFHLGLVLGADTDGDGKISYNEFATRIKSYDDKWIMTEERMRQAQLSKGK